jgi:hypothetical protein
VWLAGQKRWTRGSWAWSHWSTLYRLFAGRRRFHAVVQRVEAQRSADAAAHPVSLFGCDFVYSCNADRASGQKRVVSSLTDGTPELDPYLFWIIWVLCCDIREATLSFLVTCHTDVKVVNQACLFSPSVFTPVPRSVLHTNVVLILCCNFASILRRLLIH